MICPGVTGCLLSNFLAQVAGETIAYILRSNLAEAFTIRAIKQLAKHQEKLTIKSKLVA